MQHTLGTRPRTGGDFAASEQSSVEARIRLCLIVTTAQAWSTRFTHDGQAQENTWFGIYGKTKAADGALLDFPTAELE